MLKTRTLEQVRAQLDQEMRERRDTVVLAVDVRAEGEDSNEIEFSFSSETPVERWFGSEVLGHGPTDKVNMTRFLETGSVLMFHDTKLPVAEPLKAWVDATTRKGRVRARFDMTDPESQKYFGKVKKRLIKGVSVGYSVEKYEVTSVDEDGYPTGVRATEWTVLEVSIVTVPADATVGIGRSLPSASTPGANRAHSRLGEKAMFKLKDGREVSAPELESMRLHADVTLHDGTVLCRSIPADVFELVRGNQPTAATPAMIAATQGAKIVPVENDETIERSAFPEDAKADPVEVKRRHDIRQYVAIGRKAAPAAFPEGSEEQFIMRHDDKAKLVTAEFVRMEVSRMIDAERAKTNGAKDDATTPVVGARDGNKPGIIVGDDRNVESLRGAISQAIMIRSGVITPDGKSKRGNVELTKNGKKEEIHERANELAQLSIVDMAREYCEAYGVSTRGKTPRAILESAYGIRTVANTTSSFSTLLENALNKTMFIAYQAAPVTYREFCAVIPAKDLRAHNLYKKGVFGSLPRISEGGEVPTAQYPDGKKEILTPREFAHVFNLTTAILINDDMAAFASLVSDMGEAAAFTVEDWVYYTLLSNPTLLETGGALFNGTAITTATGHNNLTTGANAPSETTYNTMITKMAKQVAPNGGAVGTGRLLNLMPAIALVPPELATTVSKLYRDTVKIGGTNGESNPYNGLARPVVNARLSQSTLSVPIEGGKVLSASGSTTAYYLLCDPRVMPTIAVAFLDGEAPEFMESMPIDVLGRQYRAALRFGVAAADFRGAQKHNGA